jgi:hypothetical protein
MNCGSIELDFTPGDGLAVLTRLGVGPVAGIAVCKKCQNLAAPIEFESEEEYQRFISHLRKLKAKNKRDARKVPKRRKVA